jgi:ParB-like chromosome segregation protein Spo0J
MGRLNDLAEGKIDVPKLRPEIIIIRPGFNYRNMETEAVKAHVAWLEQSIMERGVQDPIEVEYTDGKVYLVDGECRLTAAKNLRAKGWDGFIPVISVRGDEAEVLARAMLANGGLPPTLLEFGKAAERLLGYGWTLEKIAQYVPPSVTGGDGSKALKFAQDAVELHQAPLEVKEQVAHGIDGVTVTPALALSATRKGRLMAPEVIKKAAAEAKAKGKKVASRPKGDGPAAKAKTEKQLALEKQLNLGDRMAKLILGENSDVDSMERAAKQWQRMRG